MDNKKSLKTCKVARISTMSFVLATQLRRQIVDMMQEGMDVTLISGRDHGMEVINELKLKHHVINFARDISLLRDFSTLFKLYWLFLKHNFSIVHSITPKAGLLVSIAGWLARTPVRLHTFTGQAWANLSGWKRWICIVMDKIIINLSTKVYADSNSQVNYLLHNKVINNVNDINVLGKGSLAGVDLDRFCIDDFPEIESARKKLGIPKNSFVFISLSRLNYEKGIYELLDAFNIVVEQYSQSFLLLVGPIDEPNSRLSKIVENFHQIKLFPYSPRPELYLSASDVLCVPSHREGFGSVVLEAAAMGIPAIGSNVVGLKDSIKHNETGILFEAGNFKELARLMVLMIEDQELKQRLQKQAQENVLKYYRSDIVSEQMISEYRQLI